jgi:intraflagellar transport protein 172
MGKDRYLVARTSNTLLLGDLATFKLSEVAWHGSGGNEKFYFENENVCMIFNAGELCLVEYGSNELLGSVRTEFTNPHLISVRINERKRSGVTDSKHMAYLVDLHTVAVVDLVGGATVLTFTHDSKINWIELNETGQKLLFRDKKLRLFFVDVSSEVKTSLLSYCSYVQWVPQSDVVVAQNQGSLCIWYNIDNTDKVSTFSIQGDIVNLERREGKTEVLVQSGVDTISYALDEGLVEFGTAIEDKDYLRGLLFLENLEMSAETETMWKTLATLTLQERKLKIAQRCFAALGDVSKVRYLQEINTLSDRIEAETGHSGLEHYQVQCKLALLEKEFKTAESILLEQGMVEDAMTMYRSLHKWDQAIRVARAKLHPDLESLEESYLKWLMETCQEEKAGELKEHNRDYSNAVTLYMKAGLPAKAARILMTHEDIASQQSVVESVATALKNSELYEMAGELYEKVRMLQQALQAYRAGKDFRRAVELARNAFPSEVVTLEEDWGDHLVSQKQYDAAIKHFIQAGANEKAIEAAIQARQWSKAVQIIDVQDQEVGQKYYQQVAEHYASVKNFELAERYFTKAGMERQLEQMYFDAGQWETAHRTAVSCMSTEEIHDKYCAKAANLENDGSLRDAERLYVAVGEHDRAISMYKNCLQYDHMIRLVEEHHNELLGETHLHLAQELEWKGQWNQAEHHYIAGGDWKGAVNMYRAHGLWDDAYRVSKSKGGQGAANQVAYLWAKSLGGESAVKLLSKFGLLEAAVDYATDNLSFDFAFEIARTALKSKLPEIHLKYALYLEDEGKYQEAEGEFVKGGKPKEAVLMWVHQQDWDAAQRVAEQHCPDSVADVFVGQARASFEKKDYHKAEGYLLRAERPDLAVKYYKDVNMWDDALRIVKEYMPNKLDEFQGEMATAFGNNTDDIISQAHSWEQSAEYRRAVEMYLKLTTQNCSDHSLLKKCWLKAVDLASKFIQDKALDVVALVCDRMTNIEEYDQAGELYMRVDMIKEALDMFMAGENWDKARNISRNVAPRYEQYVEEAYIAYLKAHNRTDEMKSVDPESALKMYADSGEWKKCLELAEKQGQKVLAKYVAMYAAHLITSGGAVSALQLFTKFGAPANPQNFNIYKKLCQDIFSTSAEGQAVYKTFADLRDVLLNLSVNLSRSPEAGSASAKEFDKLLLVAHYLATRAACDGVKQLSEVSAKLTVSLLRYTDLVPADKAFLQAGNRAKEQGWENMSFVFYNRFLDLSEAIEDGNFDMLDNTDFADTDIPMEVPLPEQPFMTEEQREDIKEWVLALSMDQRVDQVLPLDERGTYVASLVSTKTNIKSLPCMISGYPVLRSKVEFKRVGFVANKDDWNRFMMTAKSIQSRECQDVLVFLSKWCGAPTNPAYSFK